MEDRKKYPGTDTPVVSPFYRFECRNGHQSYSMTPRRICPLCCGTIETCKPANEWEESKK